MQILFLKLTPGPRSDYHIQIKPQQSKMNKAFIELFFILIFEKLLDLKFSIMLNAAKNVSHQFAIYKTSTSYLSL